MNKIFTLFVVLVFSMTSAAPSSDWKNSAIKLSGDPELRNEGLKELKANESLSSELRKALWRKEERMALDVMRALKMHEFFPKIADRIEKTNDTDLYWQLISTASALAVPDDLKKLDSILKNRILQKNVPADAIVAILSAYKEHKMDLSDSTLLKLLDHKSFEVRIAAVAAASDFTADLFRFEKTFKKALFQKPYQVRLLALQELRTNSNLRSKLKNEIKKSCQSESRGEVKSVCQEIRAL